MSGALAQALCLGAAFWLAVALAERASRGAFPGRVVLGLLLGAAFAHGGWAALHAGALRAAPGALLDPTRGFCVLFVPWGLLAAAPRGRESRQRFLAATLGTLPLPLAVARLGCLAAGCCLGAPSDLPWSTADAAGTGRHPAAACDALGCAALHLALRRLPEPLRAAAALAGLGALRLATQPLRAPPPLGDPAVDPRWLAVLWIGLGAAAALARARRRAVGPVAGRAVLP
jgi:hypothetical protein